MNENTTTDDQCSEKVLKILISLINVNTQDERQHIIETHPDIFMAAELANFYEKLKDAFLKSANPEICKKISECVTLIEAYQNNWDKRFCISGKLRYLPAPLTAALEYQTIEERSITDSLINNEGKSHLTVYDILFIFHISNRITSYHILSQYPELMSDQADEFLAKMMNDAKQNNKPIILKRLDTDRSLLKRCRQVGIKNGYCEFFKGEIDKLNIDKSVIDDDMITLFLSCKPQVFYKFRELVKGGLADYQALSDFLAEYPELAALAYKLFGVKPGSLDNLGNLVQMLNKYI